MPFSNNDLLSSGETLFKIMDTVHDTLVAIDEVGLVHLFNHSGEQTFGYKTQEIEGKNISILIPESNHEAHHSSINKYLQNRESDTVNFTSSELFGRHKNGETFPIEIIFNKIDIESKCYFIGIIRDLRQHKQVEGKLFELSHFDSLTGLYNRSFLNEYMEGAIARASLSSTEFIVLAIGIDRFHVINESLGSEQADNLLKQIANRLKTGLHTSDLLARVTGAKFSIVMEQIDSPQTIATRVDYFQKILAAPYQLTDTDVTLTTSVGICVYPRDGETPNTLLDNAYFALNSSRREGLGASHFYSPELNSLSVRRVSLESKLRRALENKEFVLHYQPKIDIESGTLHSVEALIRWLDPETNSLISPAEFIPMLEETGLVIPVGEWIFEQVCHDMLRWKMNRHSINVAINISPVQFKGDGLAEMINKVLNNNGIDPARIECELTESALLDNNDRNIEKLYKMKAIGVDIAIDDFGTGYSSLSYLSTLPLDALKIDRTFVSKTTTDPSSAAIVKTVIHLAHNLGLKVVAEGAEELAQVGFLQKHHCDLIQGFYFSKPLPADQLIDFCENKMKAFRDTFNQRKDKTLLVLDDEICIVDILCKIFEQEGYNVIGTTDINTAFDTLSTHDVGVILCDQRMPAMSGTEFLSKVKDIYPDTQRIILSGFSNMDDIINAINKGAIYKFIKKPWDSTLLKETIHDAFRIYTLLSQDQQNNA